MGCLAITRLTQKDCCRSNAGSTPEGVLRQLVLCEFDIVAMVGCDHVFGPIVAAAVAIPLVQAVKNALASRVASGLGCINLLAALRLFPSAYLD